MGKVFKAVGSVLGFSKPKMPKIAMPSEPPRQAERSASYDQQRRRNERSATAGNTNLTGPRGVDPSMNSLGRNVLLGQ